MTVKFDKSLAPRAEEIRQALEERKGVTVADGAMALIHLHRIHQYFIYRADFDPVEDADIVEALSGSLPHLMSTLTNLLGVSVAELKLIETAADIDRPNK